MLSLNLREFFFKNHFQHFLEHVEPKLEGVLHQESLPTFELTVSSKELSSTQVADHSLHLPALDMMVSDDGVR